MGRATAERVTGSYSCTVNVTDGASYPIRVTWAKLGTLARLQGRVIFSTYAAVSMESLRAEKWNWSLLRALQFSKCPGRSSSRVHGIASCGEMELVIAKSTSVLEVSWSV